MRSPRPGVVVLIGCFACNAPAYERFTTASFETGSSGSSTLASEPTTAVEPTGAPTSPGSSGDLPGTTGDNPPPEIGSFSVTPDEVMTAGGVTLRLEASPDVETVDILLNGALERTLTPGQFPYAFPVTSQAVCHGPSTFTAIVRDDRNQTDSRSAEIDCELPASGSEIYELLLPGTTGSAALGVAILPNDDPVVVGVLDGAMALWVIDDAKAQVREGWPRRLGDWTAHPELAGVTSAGRGIAVDESGAIAVVGVLGSGDETRTYAAKLTQSGAPIWEDLGSVEGEEANAVAVGERGLVFVVGSKRTSDPAAPPAFDALVRGYPGGYPLNADRWSDQIAAPPEDVVPDEGNLHSERGRGAACLVSGECVIVGERDFKPSQDVEPWTRAYAQRYASSGGRAGKMWTSSGDKFANDAALAATATSTGFALVGWGRHEEPNATEQILTQAFDLSGGFLWSASEPTSGVAAGNGVTEAREGKLVRAGSIAVGGQTDAWSFASTGPGAPLVGSVVFDNGGTFDLATAVAAGPWGHYVWVGITTDQGKSTGVISKRNP